MKKSKGWRNEPLRHSLASKGVKTGKKRSDWKRFSKEVGNKPDFKYRGTVIKKGDKLYIGDLGEAVVTNNVNDIPVHYVREESGVKSWQLNVERSDTVLHTIFVKSLEWKNLK